MAFWNWFKKKPAPIVPPKIEVQLKPGRLAAISGPLNLSEIMDQYDIRPVGLDGVTWTWGNAYFTIFPVAETMFTVDVPVRK